MCNAVRCNGLLKEVGCLVLDVREPFPVDNLKSPFAAEWCDECVALQRGTSANVDVLRSLWESAEPLLDPICCFWHWHPELFGDTPCSAPVHDSEVNTLGPHILFLDHTLEGGDAEHTHEGIDLALRIGCGIAEHLGLGYFVDAGGSWGGVDVMEDFVSAELGKDSKLRLVDVNFHKYVAVASDKLAPKFRITRNIEKIRLTTSETPSSSTMNKVSSMNAIIPADITRNAADIGGQPFLHLPIT